MLERKYFLQRSRNSQHLRTPNFIKAFKTACRCPRRSQFPLRRSIVLLMRHNNIIIPPTTGIKNAVFPSVLITKTPCVYLLCPICATFLTIIIQLHFLNRKITVINTVHEALRYRVFPFPCHLENVSNKYSPQHPIDIHSQPELFSHCDTTNIPLSTLFSYILSLSYSPTVTYKISPLAPYTHTPSG